MLLEWPDRAAGFLPPDRLDIAFTLAPQRGAEYRNVRVTGYGAFAPRAERISAVRRFLDATGFAAAERRRIQGDASTRSYERLTLGDQRAILMNAPRRPDGPPVRDGKPYSAIAHLAEDVMPFVAMANGLRQLGFSAPQIYEAELEPGPAPHRGPRRRAAWSRAIRRRRSRSAIAPRSMCWSRCTAISSRRSLPVSPHVEYRLPRYDMDAF